MSRFVFLIVVKSKAQNGPETVAAVRSPLSPTGFVHGQADHPFFVRAE